MATKKCTKCGEVKGVEEFNRDRDKPDGRECRCRQCRRVTSKPATEGEKRCADCGEVKHVTEFYACIRGPAGRYSYCKPCAQRQAAERQREPAAEGEKKCIDCGEVKHVTEFQAHRRAKDGRFYRCRLCKRERRKANLRKPADHGVKRCVKCGEARCVTEFGPDPTTTDGRRGTCRGCCAVAEREWTKTPHGRMSRRSTHRRTRFARGTNSPKPEVRGPARLAAAVLSLEHRREHEPDVDLDAAHDSHITPQIWTIDLHIRAEAAGGDVETLEKLFCLDGDALNLRPESPALNIARSNRLAYLPVPGRPEIPVFNLCRDEQVTAWALAATRLAVMRSEATGEELVSPLLDPQGVEYTDGVGFYFVEPSRPEEGERHEWYGEEG